MPESESIQEELEEFLARSFLAHRSGEYDFAFDKAYIEKVRTTDVDQLVAEVMSDQKQRSALEAAFAYDPNFNYLRAYLPGSDEILVYILAPSSVITNYQILPLEDGKRVGRDFIYDLASYEVKGLLRKREIVTTMGGFQEERKVARTAGVHVMKELIVRAKERHEAGRTEAEDYLESMTDEKWFDLFQENVDFLELAVDKGLDAAIEQYPGKYSKAYLEEKCSSDEGLGYELDSDRENLALYAFNLGRYEKAAIVERARIDWRHGEDAVPDGVDIGWRYLRAVFQAAPARERKTAMMRWFQSQGSTWFEDYPERANSTVCDSCARNLAGKAVYRNGSYARCEECTARNVDDWENTGHSLDYFGPDAVERAIKLSAGELNASLRRSMEQKTS